MSSRLGLILVILVVIGTVTVLATVRSSRAGVVARSAVPEVAVALQESPFTVTLTNRESCSVRVIGCQYTVCGSNCCFGPKQFEPFVLNAVGSAPLEFGVTPRGSGPFHAALSLYVHIRGQLVRVPITVSGDARPSP
jgi:hypothetical protein